MSVRYQKFELMQGTILQGYRIISVIGQGGFGITYLAEKDNKNVAIKELFYKEFQTRDPQRSPNVYVTHKDKEAALLKLKKGFLKEGAALQQCKGYKGLVNYLESFEANNTAYIVMEYVKGPTLKKYLQNQDAFCAAEIFHKMKPIMKSLDLIHEKGIVHRDISPDNIIVSYDGKRFTLVDFGSARMYNTMTTMTAFYKDGYSPVEQYVGDMKQGPWTDVYSMGTTMYYAMTKRHPLSSVTRIVYDEIRWPSKMGVDISPEYEKILKGMMAASPEKRMQNFQSVLEGIQQLQGDGGLVQWISKKIFNA